MTSITCRTAHLTALHLCSWHVTGTACCCYLLHCPVECSPGTTTTYPYYYYYYKSTDYSDASLKLQGHFTYQIFFLNDGTVVRSQLYDS